MEVRRKCDAQCVQGQDHFILGLQMEQTPCEHPGPGRPPPAAAAAQDRADHPPPGCGGLPRHMQVVLVLLDAIRLVLSDA